MEHPAALSTQDSELDDFRLSDAGARDLARPRGSSSQSVFTVKHTDPLSFIEDMTKDAKVIVDQLVRLSISGGRANRAQVDYPHVPPGGHLDEPWFRSRYVEATYQARGQLVKIVCYCGVVYVGPHEGFEEKTRETTLKLQSTLRQMQVAIMHAGLDRRGGVLDVEDPTDTWRPDWLASITDPEPVKCLHCGEEIYYSNEAWRHTATKRAEANVDAIGASGKRIKKLDHYAEPEDEAAA